MPYITRDRTSYVRLAALSSLLTLSWSCASTYPQIHTARTGELQPARDAEDSQIARRIKSVPDVKVYDATADRPDTGSRAGPGSTKLGQVTVSYDDASADAFFKSALWTWDYHERWRSALCTWQVPFKLLTLGLWTALSPLAWPCISKVPRSSTDRMSLAVDEIRRGSAAIGGNLAVVVRRAASTTSTVLPVGNSAQIVQSLYPDATIVADVFHDPNHPTNAPFGELIDPLYIDLGLLVGYAEVIGPGEDTLGPGLGFTVGYTVERVHVGGRFVTFPSGIRYGEYGGDFSVLDVSVDMGYDLQVGQSWTIRPQLGLGFFAGDYKTTGYVGLAGLVQFYVTSSLFLGGELKSSWLLSDLGPNALLTLGASIFTGIRF